MCPYQWALSRSLKMQVPTCNSIRIRSMQDAHKIFYAIQRGLLHMVTRRLDADERSMLGSGCVYAWEERGPHSEITGLGIERFTEGRRWSPSRVRDVCSSASRCACRTLSSSPGISILLRKVYPSAGNNRVGK